MGQKKKQLKGDAFAPVHDHALSALHGRPAWWLTLWVCLVKYRSHETAQYEGGMAAIQLWLRSHKVRVSDSTVRHALRRFAELGLMGRDKELNEHTRRFKFVLRRTVAQSVGDLISAVRVCFGRLAEGSVQRGNAPQIDRLRSQGYQIPGSYIQKRKEEPKTGISDIGRQALAALGRQPKLILSAK